MNDNPRPGDANRTEPGDEVCLLIGTFDPPTMDVLRAASGLFETGKVKSLWLCPLFETRKGFDAQSVSAMSQISCVEFMGSCGKQIGCCTFGLDKKLTKAEEVLALCKRLYPFMKFKVAMLFIDATPLDPLDFIVCFHGQQPIPGAFPVMLTKFLPMPSNSRSKIADNLDVSRTLPEAVWKYISKKNLYKVTSLG